MRRIVPAILVGLGLGGCHSTPKPLVVSVPPLATLRSYVPADLRIRFSPVPLDKDGRMVFEKAMSVMPRDSGREARYPTMAHIRKNLAACKSDLARWNLALDQTVAATMLPDWSSPLMGDSELDEHAEDPSVAGNQYQSLTSLKLCVQWLAARGYLFAVEGDSRVAEQFEACYRAGSALASGRGPTVDFLVAESIFGSVDSALQTDAFHLPTVDLARILKAIPDEERLSLQFKDVLRAELDNELRVLKSAVVSLLKPGPEGASLSAALEGHPNLFDANETVEIIVKSHLPLLAAVSKPFDQRGDLEPDFKQYAVDLPDFDGQEMSAEQTKSFREKAVKVPNLLGRARALELGTSRLSTDILDGLDRTRADLLATRLLVATELYRRKHGAVPAGIQSLVDDGLLHSVPLDPFDGKPFRFDAKRMVVWSVGEDGQDNGGHDQPGIYQRKAKDIVWALDAHSVGR